MILVKITNEQLFALKADSNFAPLADSLLSIQSLRTARGGFKPRKDGWIEVDEEYLSFATILALNGVHGIEIGDMSVYIEVPTSKLTDEVPDYLPNATKQVEQEDGNYAAEPAIWEDLVSRTSLDGIQNIVSLSKRISISQLATLLTETGITAMNHTDTLIKINDNYQDAEIV